MFIQVCFLRFHLSPCPFDKFWGHFRGLCCAKMAQNQYFLNFFSFLWLVTLYICLVTVNIFDKVFINIIFCHSAPYEQIWPCSICLAVWEWLKMTQNQRFFYVLTCFAPSFIFVFDHSRETPALLAC